MYIRYLLIDTINKTFKEFTEEQAIHMKVPTTINGLTTTWIFGDTEDEYIKLRDGYIESAFNPPKQEEDLYTELSTVSFRNFKKILKEGDDLNILTGGSVEWLEYKFKQYMVLDLK